MSLRTLNVLTLIATVSTVWAGVELIHYDPEAVYNLPAVLGCALLGVGTVPVILAGVSSLLSRTNVASARAVAVVGLALALAPVCLSNLVE